MTIQQLLVANGANALKAIDAVTAAGLTSNLQLCLDAGDANSYTSGTKWLDVSGNGYDFDITTASFTGTAGNLTSYFTGTGGYFTYDAANESWMNALHKDNAAYSFMTFYYPVVVTDRFCGTNANSTSNIGMQWYMPAGSSPRIRVTTGSGSALSDTSGSVALNTSAWNAVGLSINEAAGAAGSFHWGNGSSGLFTGTYTSPSASDATYTFQIAADGNADGPLPNGSRIAIFLAWSTALTTANMTTLWGLLRGRFGI